MRCQGNLTCCPQVASPVLDYPNNVCHSPKSFFSTQASAYISKIINDLNNLLLLYVHKEQTVNLDLASVAKEFIARNEERMNYFGDY